MMADITDIDRMTIESLIDLLRGLVDDNHADCDSEVVLNVADRTVQILGVSLEDDGHRILIHG